MSDNVNNTNNDSSKKHSVFSIQRTTNNGDGDDNLNFSFNNNYVILSEQDSLIDSADLQINLDTPQTQISTHEPISHSTPSSILDQTFNFFNCCGGCSDW